MSKFQKTLWIGLLVMLLLSPLGLLLPEKFKAEDPWEKWGMEKLEKVLGYVPEGLKRFVDLWKAPIPDYSVGGERASMTIQVLSYIFSGLLGIGICAFIVYMVSRLNGKR